MKPLYLLALLAAPALAVESGTAIPEALPQDRYTKLRSESPFVLATAQKEPPEPVVPWAQNLYLGSVARVMQNGEEKDWVIIKDRTQPGNLINLYGSDPNGDYQLVKLEWADDPRKTKASVKKGGEFATLEPDQAAFATAAAVPVPGPGGKPPGGPVGVPIAPGAANIRPPNGLGVRPGQPNLPMPGGVRPPSQIPRPGGQPAVSLPQPVSPGNQGTSPATRQRVRVINSTPNTPQ